MALPPRTVHPRPVQSRREEIANSLSHGVGLVLAVAGLAVLVACAALRGGVEHVVTCAVFGVSLVLLYAASTLYHGVRHHRVKPLLRVLDHSAIFLLIAGTYTPFTLVSLEGPWGWSLFTVVWGLAVVGIVLRATLRGKGRIAFPLLYVAMGWVVVVAAGPMLEAVAPGGLVLLLLGGLAYTAGVAFYAWNRLPYNHAIWHGFVLAGSILHFFAVLYYVIPPPLS
jgi:hemolysin III